MNKNSLFFALSFLLFNGLSAQDSYTPNPYLSLISEEGKPIVIDLEIETIEAESPSVVLSRFERDIVGETMLLRWVSEREIDNQHYMVQRSLDDGKTYRTIGEIEGANTASEYIFLDDVTENYTEGTKYRLAQVSTSGVVYFFTEL